MMPREPRKRGKGKHDKKKRGISKQISLWVLFVMEELQQIKQLASLIIKYVKMLLLCEFT